MKNIGLNLIKDLMISILIVASIILILSIVLYDKIPLSKVIPESEEYTLTNEMQEDLVSVNQEDENIQVVTTYHIDAADLKKYEKTKEYNKGKKNPFAEESITSNNATVNGNNVNSIEPSNNNSTNFYDDDGTK